MDSVSWALLHEWRRLWAGAAEQAHVDPVLVLAAQACGRLRQRLPLGALPVGGRSTDLLRRLADEEELPLGLEPLDLGEPEKALEQLALASAQDIQGQFPPQVTADLVRTTLASDCGDLVRDAQRLTNPKACLAQVQAAGARLAAALAALPPPAGVAAAGRQLRVAREIDALAATLEAGAGPATAAGAEAAEPRDQTAQAAPPVYKVYPETSGYAAPAPPELLRTESQVKKKLVVERVKKTSEQREHDISTLRRTVSALATTGDALPERHTKVRKLTQQCRDFTEDLMEGMMALDNLSNMPEQDRKDRKETLRAIEPLLEELDKTKARLFKMEKEMAGLLAAEQAAAEQAAEREAKRSRPTLELPRVDWATEAVTRVPLHVQPEPHAYVVTARVPGLREDQVHLAVEGDQLVARGLRAPTSAELEKLHARVLHFLKRVPPEQLPTISETRLKELIVQIAEGQFGAFVSAINLGPDVDTQQISGDVQDGVLRIVLPRRPRYDFVRRPDFW